MMDDLRGLGGLNEPEKQFLDYIERKICNAQIIEPHKMRELYAMWKDRIKR